MTAAEQMRALASSFVHESDEEGLARQRTEFRTALRAAADQLDAAQKWLDYADTLAQGDSPYLPDLQDIIDGKADL